ncbi:unnamed protein product [marine sediment metagenome]|uniref:Uncharacterized protein n=1 Tax=marine sediment metagenome TaxID=412755 RepID=X0SZM7_9ZZZZ
MEKVKDTFGVYDADAAPHHAIKGTLVRTQVERCLKALADLWETSVRVEMEIWHWRHKYIKDPASAINFKLRVYRADTQESICFDDFLALHKYVEKEVRKYEASS